jgi:cytoskeletal protein CcmA (bactofilin family)
MPGSEARRDAVARFGSKGRGDKTSSTSRDKNPSTDTAEDGRWSTSSVAKADATGPDGDPASRERQSALGARPGREGGNSMATIGQSIVFKGELSGDEDLEIDGQVEGNVRLENHELTIGPNGRLEAELSAKSIIVIGRVKGNLTATERIEIQASGIVEGDVQAPRLNVQEGAVLNGTIHMTAPGRSDAKQPSASTTTPARPASPSTGATAQA